MRLGCCQHAQRLKIAERPTAVLFFAGHGKQHESGYALLPHDYHSANLAGSAISVALFHAQIASIRQYAQKLIVLLNCCPAGGVGGGVLSADAAAAGESPPPAFYRPLAAGSSQVVISSSRPEQQSGARSATNPRHSTFGAQLLAALAGEAPGAGPGIGVFELFTALRQRVPLEAAQIAVGGAPLRQEPLFYASQLDDDIAVALRPLGDGATLGGGAADVRRLVALELQIEAAGRAALPALRAACDALLRSLA